jgi:hypothetical protein
MYHTRISEGEIAGLLYVCANDELADHVHKHATQAGIRPGHGLWIELLDQIREQTRNAARRPVGVQAAPAVRWADAASARPRRRDPRRPRTAPRTPARSPRRSHRSAHGTTPRPHRRSAPTPPRAPTTRAMVPGAARAAAATPGRAASRTPDRPHSRMRPAPAPPHQRALEGAVQTRHPAAAAHVRESPTPSGPPRARAAPWCARHSPRYHQIAPERRILRHLGAHVARGRAAAAGQEHVEIRAADHPLARPSLRCPECARLDPPPHSHDGHVHLRCYLRRRQELEVSHGAVGDGSRP